MRSDRDMEYIHMKEMRAAWMQPVNVISKYKWKGGLGYYESTKDASTNFFFGWLPKGTYVFDQYGAYKTRLPFLHWKDFEVIEKNIYGFDEKYYYAFLKNTPDLRTYALPLPLKEYSSLKLGNNCIYILKNNQVQLFDLN